MSLLIFTLFLVAMVLSSPPLHSCRSYQTLDSSERFLWWETLEMKRCIAMQKAWDKWCFRKLWEYPAGYSCFDSPKKSEFSVYQACPCDYIYLHDCHWGSVFACIVMMLPRQGRDYRTPDTRMRIQQVAKDRLVILFNTWPCIDRKSIAVPTLMVLLRSF